jgi:hypothetical protein
MKAIRKDKIIQAESIESTLLEKKILFEANHTFMVSMKFAF